MPVIPLVEYDKLTPQMKEMVDMFDTYIGDTVWARLMARCPEIFLKFNDLYATLLGGKVETEIKELARLRMAYLNGCDY
jgi:alkylhydroperoxidase family enzyme